MEPIHDRMDPGRPSKAMVKTLMEDIGAASTSELSTIMDKDSYRESCLACSPQRTPFSMVNKWYRGIFQSHPLYTSNGRQDLVRIWLENEPRSYGTKFLVNCFWCKRLSQHFTFYTRPSHIVSCFHTWHMESQLSKPLLIAVFSLPGLMKSAVWPLFVFVLVRICTLVGWEFVL